MDSVRSCKAKIHLAPGNSKLLNVVLKSSGALTHKQFPNRVVAIHREELWHFRLMVQNLWHIRSLP